MLIVLVDARRLGSSQKPHPTFESYFLNAQVRFHKSSSLSPCHQCASPSRDVRTENSNFSQIQIQDLSTPSLDGGLEDVCTKFNCNIQQLLRYSSLKQSGGATDQQSYADGMAKRSYHVKELTSLWPSFGNKTEYHALQKVDWLQICCNGLQIVQVNL